VLLFGVPANLLAQRWSIMGGNLVAAFWYESAPLLQTDLCPMPAV
jgi:CBS-domain-containing membrane protein